MIKKDIKRAVALRYEPDTKNAPHIIAKGKGEIANKIIEKGNKHDIQIHEDRALVQLLYQLDINEQIPVELYPIIAEVFSMVYRAEKIVEKIKKDG